MNRYYEQIGVAVTCRGFDEYMRMFALEEALLAEGELLDVAGGASSFAAEACRLGYRASAADPRYALEPAAVRSEAEREIETSTAKLAGLADRMDFSYYGSLDAHRAMRERSLALFAADYEAQGRNGRYTAAALPSLPYADGRFRLVTVSHFLFLYAEQFGADFHRASLRELLRVCRPGGEVRIYPLYSLRYERYPLLDELAAELAAEGIGTEYLSSRLPFIPDSTQLLRLSK